MIEDRPSILRHNLVCKGKRVRNNTGSTRCSDEFAIRVAWTQHETLYCWYYASLHWSRKFDGRMHFVGRAISANQTTSEHKKRSVVGFIRYPIVALTQLTPIQANTSPPTFRLGWCAAQCAVHFQRYAKKVWRWFFFENPVQFTG